MSSRRSRDPTLATPPLSARRQRFCEEYLIDLNGTRAALRAGYAPSCADQQASRLLRDPQITREIGALKAARTARVEITADEVLRWLGLIAFADMRKLVALRIAPCRYCRGKGHQYQWTTEREYRAACDDAVARQKTRPSAAGGFGYRRTDAPDPDCPECSGLGLPYAHYPCSSGYGPSEVAVFHGLRQTRQGVDLRLSDRLRALELLGAHCGLFDRANASDPADPFRNMLDQLLQSGSKAPVQ